MGSVPRKRKAISLEAKLAIIDDHRQGTKVTFLAQKHRLSQSTISTILKNEEKLRKEAAGSGASAKRKRIQDRAYEDIEEAVYKWFLDARSRKIPISGPVLAAKAKHFAYLLDEDLKPCGGWLQRFKDRYGITYRRIVGESASMDRAGREAWLDEHLEDIFQRYTECNIYNGDETGLFYQLLPSATHALKGEDCAGGKHSKVRLTVFLCSNMDGSDRRKPFVIGKSKKPRGFSNPASVPVHYRYNQKAWMTRALFQEWLEEFDRDMLKQQRKVLLLLDNCTAHQVNVSLSSVEVLFLPPNTTSGLQAMDMGVIANVKAFYRRRVVDRMIFNIDRSKAQGTDDVPDLKVTPLMAVQFVNAAWYEVRRSTIRNCFLKGGFVPPVPADDDLCDDGTLLEDDEVTDGIRSLWQQATDSNLVDREVSLEDYINSDDHVLATEEFTDEAIVNEVRELRDGNVNDASSDEDDDASPRFVRCCSARSRRAVGLRCGSRPTR
ncbi:tigger transposable element-derived protein 6-like [Ornithodoros turicata]|uniref:tigger transposable element-derived protein 6-like n=1 Tax=Ornithodoros turicata TaxID=34597 RepID=UPI0031391FDB